MILGTIALIWTIPSVNLFGVIAVIVSWIAYSNSKKNMAYVSTGMYIAATVISILLRSFFCLQAECSVSWARLRAFHTTQ